MGVYLREGGHAAFGRFGLVEVGVQLQDLLEGHPTDAFQVGQGLQDSRATPGFEPPVPAPGVSGVIRVHGGEALGDPHGVPRGFDDLPGVEQGVITDLQVTLDTLQQVGGN